MKILTKPEELLLLAICNLRENAYGVEILKYLSGKTGSDWSIGSVYIPLDRLARLGYIESYQGKPEARRGGKSKRFFRITDAGFTILRNSLKVQSELVRGIPELSVLKEK